MTETATPPAATPVAPQGAAANAKSEGSDYVILTFDEDTDGWAEYGDHLTARSTESAIRKHAERTGNKEGIYIAIHARSWKPVTVTVETATVVKIGTAK